MVQGESTCTGASPRARPEAVLVVAVQVARENPNFETKISHFRFKGLKLGACKLWVNWICELVVQPHFVVVVGVGRFISQRHVHVSAIFRGVALQVAFERQTLKPAFSIYRL
jgi:hypothetical protein